MDLELEGHTDRVEGGEARHDRHVRDALGWRLAVGTHAVAPPESGTL